MVLTYEHFAQGVCGLQIRFRLEDGFGRCSDDRDDTFDSMSGNTTALLILQDTLQHGYALGMRGVLYRHRACETVGGSKILLPSA